jgi:hypothetical protein
MKEPHGYAPVNGLKMYYEIEGAGDPLVHFLEKADPQLPLATAELGYHPGETR